MGKKRLAKQANGQMKNNGRPSGGIQNSNILRNPPPGGDNPRKKKSAGWGKITPS